MKITIHQPEHLPWLGFFNKMSNADKFVYLDNVQYRKNYFQNRNKIVGTNGPQWLTVPVNTKNHINNSIMDMEICNNKSKDWRKTYYNTIMYSYKKHPYFEKHIHFFEKLTQKEWGKISELNYEIINYFVEVFQMKVEFCKASELEVSGTNSELILNICKSLNADTYISGPSGRDYLNIDDFKASGIEVVFNDFEHPIYKQYGRTQFTPFMSTIDLLFNLPEEEALNVIKNKG